MNNDTRKSIFLPNYLPEKNKIKQEGVPKCKGKPWVVITERLYEE